MLLETLEKTHKECNWLNDTRRYIRFYAPLDQYRLWIISFRDKTDAIYTAMKIDRGAFKFVEAPHRDWQDFELYFVVNPESVEKDSTQ